MLEERVTMGEGVSLFSSPFRMYCPFIDIGFTYFLVEFLLLFSSSSLSRIQQLVFLLFFRIQLSVSLASSRDDLLLGSACRQCLNSPRNGQEKWLLRVERSKSILPILSSVRESLQQNLVLSRVINQRRTMAMENRSALYRSYLVSYSKLFMALSCSGANMNSQTLSFSARALQQATCLLSSSTSSKYTFRQPSGLRQIFPGRYSPTAIPNLFKQRASSTKQAMMQTSYDSGKRASCIFFLFIASARVKLQQLQQVWIFLFFMHIWFSSWSSQRWIFTRFLCSMFFICDVSWRYFLSFSLFSMKFFLQSRIQSQGVTLERKMSTEPRLGSSTFCTKRREWTNCWELASSADVTSPMRFLYSPIVNIYSVDMHLNQILTQFRQLPSFQCFYSMLSLADQLIEGVLDIIWSLLKLDYLRLGIYIIQYQSADEHTSFQAKGRPLVPCGKGR